MKILLLFLSIFVLVGCVGCNEQEELPITYKSYTVNCPQESFSHVQVPNELFWGYGIKYNGKDIKFPDTCVFIGE